MYWNDTFNVAMNVAIVADMALKRTNMKEINDFVSFIHKYNF